MKYFNIILFFTLLTACSSEPKKEVLLRTEKGQTTPRKNVNPDKLLTLKIEGMTCEMGCGGSIRKELKATGSVQRVKFDFVEGRPIQTAMIFFDSKNVSEKQLAKIVATMNDKQFSVKGMQVQAIKDVATTTESSRETTKEKTIEMSESNVTLPNLFDILSSFF